jgi:hypothetical protein
MTDSCHGYSGGNDVFVDIGDKAWGVLTCQRYFGGIKSAMTLHIGDQFLSAGSNDFKVGPHYPSYHILSWSPPVSFGELSPRWSS